ncbi:hypothetical protein RE628_27670 [Paenibacillus sp. D2_2]|uniref:hypothetical protein n=1 Tax=Paenibacillus sp. D2_2 TaxID=3073092 RepID=UPI002814F956|nr:hypothetical protein [Paenibacillus sp. D2_2]WMT40828.1 hypothetical protein RE628_27670 [Paenibacillus sp. D2_2]
MALGAGNDTSDQDFAQLDKRATSTGNYGEWQVTLTVEGKQLKTQTPTDIVLVIDKSGSMGKGKALA